MTFTFVDDPGAFARPEDFVLAVPAGIRTKADLLTHYERAGQFPYFGRNWDALRDCLSDFSWIEQKRIVIVHVDLPLSDHLDELDIYLGILADSEMDWRDGQDGPFVGPAAHWSANPRKVAIVFPVALRELIEG